MSLVDSREPVARFLALGSVATRMRCGGIFKNYFTANLPENLPVKEF